MIPGHPSHDHGQIFEASPEFKSRAHVPSLDAYRRLYAESVQTPESFWMRMAERLRWMRAPKKCLEYDFHRAIIRWFDDGILNVTDNCLDRHIDAGLGDRTAILWEGDDPKDSRRLSYAELLREVCHFARVLKKLGVQKGDRICLYMPMVPELAIAMLACARIGAVHSIIFGGFSAESLRDRIEDAQAKLVICADEGVRGGKKIPLKATADEAIAKTACVEHLIVFRRTGAAIDWVPGRDLWWHEEMASADVQAYLPPEPMGAEDPLFILYTSGSTGRPKGVLHTTAGYLLHTSLTHELVFDHKPEDIYWCTADIGWVTGHSYIVYGPLANAATTLLFEGVPSYPDYGRFWDVVDKHGVTIFYTAPTAIRSLMQHGEGPVKARSRKSLRLLGSVGEPINPEAWLWYHSVVGEGRCPVVDTWWQTETGGILIAPLPGATPLKPGSATLPLPGVRPALVDEEGRRLEENGVAGNLVIEFPWPGMMRTVYGDHERFLQTYFARFPGRYFTGDGAFRDTEGYYWITGRVDDVLNVSGHRLGTAEVESALVTHPACVEAAVVGMPHAIKGEGIFVFVILSDEAKPSEALRKELIQTVRKEIGPLATPDVVRIVPGLPKTRSGKIMRRILRKIAAGQFEELGDVSTLSDPTVVPKLMVDALGEGPGR